MPMVSIIFSGGNYLFVSAATMTGCGQTRRMPQPMKRQKDSSSYCGSKVMASDDEGNGSDGGNKWQSNRFIVSNMFYSIATCNQL